LGNNPVRYTDPSGHEICLEDGYCFEPNEYSFHNHANYYGVSFSEGWDESEKLNVIFALQTVGEKLANIFHGSFGNSFKHVFGLLKFNRSENDPGYGAEYSYENRSITFYQQATGWNTLVPHELGHAFRGAVLRRTGKDIYSQLSSEGIWVGGEQIAGYNENYTQPGTGETCNGQQCYGENGPILPNHYLRTSRGLGFQENITNTANEDFADTFANWAIGKLTDDAYGSARSDFITTNLSEWIP
jgi:hypothetical protein